MRIIIRNKYSKFKEMFYRKWYNNILNFDLIAINGIKSDIQKDINSNESGTLSELVSKFIGMNIALDDNIQQSTSVLTEKLDEFLKLKQTGGFASYQDVIASMQSGIEKTGELGGSYEQIHANINTALSGLNELIASPKTNIDALNKNAALLKKIRDKFSSYKEKAYSAELTQLKKITSTLGENIDNTFVSIETALKKTTQSLGDSYDRFFYICTMFNETYSATVDSKQIADALLILMQENRKLDECFKKYSANFSEETC
jgi:hypothetical protein